MFRRIVLPAVLFAVLIAAILFAALNPGPIDVDLGLYEARTQKATALIVAFAVGWVFGMLCLAAVLGRMALERRRLRKALRLAESEVHTLRTLPGTHAD